MSEAAKTLMQILTLIHNNSEATRYYHFVKLAVNTVVHQVTMIDEVVQARVHVF